MQNPNASSHSDVDIRHAEFLAMTGAFLGDDYDANKLGQVESLQIEHDQFVFRCANQLTEGTLSRIEYARLVNEHLRRTFDSVERVLGPEDFKRLFGADPEHAGGLIDENEFAGLRRFNDDQLQ